MSHPIVIDDYRFLIEVDSTVFIGLKHLIEVNLFCDEKINYNEFEFLMASTKKVNYPPIVDQWICCNLTYARYSDIVQHVEKIHLPYMLESTTSAFKHACPQCQVQFMAYNGLITHFLKSHVDNQVLCLQCSEKFTRLEDYCAHASNCQ